MMLATVGLLLVTMSVAPADLTGKWEGKAISQRSDGSTDEDPALLILTQKNTTITGSVGSGESDQHPITSGTLDGNRMTLVARAANGREYRIELTVEGDELKGTVASGDRKADVRAKRRRD